MIFWLLALTITVIACAALYYAALGRTVNASAAEDAAATTSHFRLQLGEIEAAMAAGRLAAAEGIAAKAELAREMLRQQREAETAPRRAFDHPLVFPVAVALVAIIAFATYSRLGSPDLPSQPFASRPEEAATAATIDMDKAVKTVEARLATNPDDIRGWQVIAPIYMRSGRYADAEHAFRQILVLAPPTADGDTDLAEALMMQNDGAASGEAMDLLNRAAALDPKHIRSRFYLAAEAMREKNYASAVSQWSAIVAMGQGTEAWLPTAKAGLAAAEAGRDGKPLPDASAAAGPAQSPAIVGMVKGLADRLAKNGGPLADWTQLVRSEIVLGDLAQAQAAYDSARKAYPDAGDRAELDGLAAQAGLKIDGASP